MPEALHERYVPILRFARGEQFYPMAVDDFLSYCTLRAKGEPGPLVARGKLSLPMLARAYRERPELYLQSVPAEVAEQNVIAGWSEEVQRSLVQASFRAFNWQHEAARLAYRWLSAKTEPAARLFWWNDLLMPLVGPGRRSARELPRLNLPPEIREAALLNYKASQEPRPGYTYYYRSAREGRYHCLQYWLFYAYNDWATGFGGMNDHEGDWEGIYLFFEVDEAGRLREPPAYITYVGHHSRLTKPWGHPDVTLEGTHPVAFVAAGSHAMYPERKEYDLMAVYGLTDLATGDGPAVGPDDWQRRVELEAEPWTEPFLGGWGTRYWLSAPQVVRIVRSLRTQAGEIGLPGVSAPRGPRYADDGAVRPNWTAAALWAGLMDPG